MNAKLVRLVGWTAAGFAGLLAILFIGGVAAGYAASQGVMSLDQVTVGLMGLLAVAVMVGGLIVGVIWMRSIDEAAREAHKSAWFWGGSVGMAVAGVGAILAGPPQARDWSPPVLLLASQPPSPALYMASGAFGTMLLMLAGYTVAWGVWWARRR